MNYAIRSLLKHGDSGWVVGAVARLPNVRNNTQRLHLAGELAQVGRYDGWDMIETAIVAGEPSQRYTALFEVGKFRAMKDGSGNPVDLLAKLDQLRLRAPESAKTAIAQAIVRIGSEGILLPNIGSEYSIVSGCRRADIRTKRAKIHAADSIRSCQRFSARR